MAWGLEQRKSLQFRNHFLNATENIKDKLRIVLGKFLQKRAEKQFEEMKSLIMEFDIGDPNSASQFLASSAPVVKKEKDKAMDLKGFNLDVIEEQDDLEESHTNLPSMKNLAVFNSDLNEVIRKDEQEFLDKDEKRKLEAQLS